MLRNAAVPRRAFAVIYDRGGNHLYEAVADLATGVVASWKEIAGAQPPVGSEDSGIADRMVRADSRCRDALRARGIRDPNAVYTVAWPAGYFDLPGEADQRIVRVTPYFAAAGANYYAHPVEGVAAHVNLTTGKVIDFVDIDRKAPLPRGNDDLSPGGNRSLPPAARAAPDHAAFGSGVPDPGRRGALAEVALPVRAASAGRASAVHGRATRTAARYAR